MGRPVARVSVLSSFWGAGPVGLAPSLGGGGTAHILGGETAGSFGVERCGGKSAASCIRDASSLACRARHPAALPRPPFPHAASSPRSPIVCVHSSSCPLLHTRAHLATLSVPSPTVTMNRLPGPRATQHTSPWWPWSAARGAPVLRHHTLHSAAQHAFALCSRLQHALNKDASLNDAAVNCAAVDSRGEVASRGRGGEGTQGAWPATSRPGTGRVACAPCFCPWVVAPHKHDDPWAQAGVRHQGGAGAGRARTSQRWPVCSCSPTPRGCSP